MLLPAALPLVVLLGFYGFSGTLLYCPGLASSWGCSVSMASALPFCIVLGWPVVMLLGFYGLFSLAEMLSLGSGFPKYGN